MQLLRERKQKALEAKRKYHQEKMDYYYQSEIENFNRAESKYTNTNKNKGFVTNL